MTFQHEVITGKSAIGVNTTKKWMIKSFWGKYLDFLMLV